MLFEELNNLISNSKKLEETFHNFIKIIKKEDGYKTNDTLTNNFQNSLDILLSMNELLLLGTKNKDTNIKIEKIIYKELKNVNGFNLVLFNFIKSENELKEKELKLQEKNNELKEKDNELKEVIQEKDNELKEVIQEKNNELKEVIQKKDNELIKNNNLNIEEKLEDIYKNINSIEKIEIINEIEDKILLNKRMERSLKKENYEYLFLLLIGDIKKIDQEKLLNYIETNFQNRINKFEYLKNYLTILIKSQDLTKESENINNLKLDIDINKDLDINLFENIKDYPKYSYLLLKDIYLLSLNKNTKEMSKLINNLFQKSIIIFDKIIKSDKFQFQSILDNEKTFENMLNKDITFDLYETKEILNAIEYNEENNIYEFIDKLKIEIDEIKLTRKKGIKKSNNSIKTLK
jgi:hypothetical protein